MIREELEKEAKLLGIEVDGRWGDKKLADKIAAAKASSSETKDPEVQWTSDQKETPEQEVVHNSESVEVINCHNGLWQLPDSTYIKPGKSGALTKEQSELPQVKKAIETGFLKVK